MLIGLLTAVHVVVCGLLILVVLLQKGKGQDFASTFGGGGTQTAFGARSGTTILHRATTAAAIIFMLTSLTLTILLSRTGQTSVLGSGAPAPAATTPAPTEPQPVAPAGVGDSTPAAPDATGGVAAPADDEEATPED